MNYRPRLLLAVSVAALVVVLALLPAVTATATEGTMHVVVDTTLNEDHNGPIEISAENVALDCAGHTVSGASVAINAAGINVLRDGVTVRNCVVSGFTLGIRAKSVSGILLANNVVSDNEEVGIDLLGIENSEIMSNVSTGNFLQGIFLGQSDGVALIGNTVTGNRDQGILLIGSTQLSVSRNIAAGNLYGIAIDETHDSLFTLNDASDNETGFLDFRGFRNTFTSNTAHRNTDWGFYLANTADSGTYALNRCIGNGRGGSAASTSGLFPLLLNLCDESGTFADDDASVFQWDIEWMASEGITKGCNPPTNDLFCPDSTVTRGQMAAFLVRALGLTNQLVNPFTDDDGHVFEADIEKLAAAGITKGCNPPTNDRFCPDGKVTREQMAAFLVRALGYTDDGGGDLFVDDDLSIFEADIDRLATAGVTKGCNPPTNDRFCPTGYVTRGQMAAFLHRALG